MTLNSTNDNNLNNKDNSEMTVSENSNILNTVADIIAQESGTKCSLCSLNVGTNVRQHLIQVSFFFSIVWLGNRLINML